METVRPQPPGSDHVKDEKSPTVLVVDDDSRVVELLQITLGGRGFRVLAAHDGEEALASVDSNHPDFLVLDVRLPRRSGLDVCETLRKDDRFRTLPIILISGNAATESRLQGLRSGADDYLTKPFSPRELLMKMQRILERNHDRDVLALRAEVLEEEVRRQRDRLREIRTDFQAHIERLGTILERIQELNRHRSISEILDRFILTAVGIMDFDAVALLVAEDGVLLPRIHRGLKLHDPGTLQIDPGGLTGEILGSHDHAVATEELALRSECQREAGLLATAGLIWNVGVRVGGTLRAVLSIGERSDRRPLDRFDLRLVEALAASVGTSLANAEAFDRTQSSFLETITSLLAAFEARHEWLAGHSERVKQQCIRLGAAVGLEAERLDTLATAALLHNLGAVERHESLLRDAAVLSPAERKLRQQEASEAAGRLFREGHHEGIAEILRHQAEYWDGSGVPDGLKGTVIPLGSRILSIANAYDALRSERPHRSSYSDAQAREVIAARAGKQFDPDLVRVFLDLP